MLPFLGPLIDSATKGLDSLFTSDEERLKGQAELKKLEVEMEKSMNDHMNKVVDAQKSILTQELSSGSWLARNWRPILMTVFITMLAYNYLLIPLITLIRTTFDLDFIIPDVADIPEKVWSLLQIGLGGYIVGRSGEKIADKLKRKL